MEKANNDYLEKFLLPIYLNTNLTATEKWYKISHEFQKYITLQRKDMRPNSTDQQKKTNLFKNNQLKIKKNEEEEKEENTKIEELLEEVENKDISPINKFISYESKVKQDNTGYKNKSSQFSNIEKNEDYVLPDLKSSPMPAKISTAAASARKLKNYQTSYDNMRVFQKGDSVYTVFDQNSNDLDDICEGKVKKGQNTRVSPVITRSKTNDDSSKKLAKEVRTGSSMLSTRRHHAALRWDALED